ncbi:MAG: bifunctional chorismate mutase/prephenate dehydratase [Oscillospiraceae bacterium]|nr:bifunctional chorismate mutase/prephenate dehydratase [Oscillospiraceae bacterium]MCI9562828.1 bifunctional chorismate mutase/prephenate dehydratase [Oscillospiraceae bacterium]
MELKDYREQLDQIDDQLAALFKRRMETVKQVADYKKEHNTPVLAAGRERDILYRVTGLCGEELQEYTKILYSTLLELSRDYQENRLSTGDSPLCRQIMAAAEACGEFPSRAVVACQGVEGAYSQLACDKMFSLPQIMYCNRFDGVFRAVETGMCRYGILPIENSSAGSVTEVYDLMEKYNCKIVRSLKLKIEHCLLARPGVKQADIKEVVAHEQALNQCGDFLKSSGVKVTVFDNNAKAAQYVAESGRNDLAAIASAACADLYGLAVLSDRVSNSDHNYTRFICISKSLEIYEGASKITFVASASHRPGSLYSLIAKFATRGINISKLESRPIPGKDFEFRFYFDVDASVSSHDVQTVLSQLEKEGFFTFLGAYSEVF